MHGSSEKRTGSDANCARARARHRWGGAARGARARAHLLADHGKLARVPALETREDVRERCVRDAQHFVVVLVNAHLEVEAGELAQMAARVGVLGAKNWTHLEHALEIGRDRHLLVQLRRLREARRAPEVIGAEDLGPAFGLARDELGRVDLDKAALEQRLRAPRSLRFSRAPSGRTQRASVGAYLAKESAHARLDAHDGVVRGNAQVQPTVVEALFLADARERPLGVLRGIDFFLGSRRVFE